MEARPYKTRAGVTQYKPVVTLDEAHEGTLGFCLACGAEAYGVEPDARRYVCESCRAPKVYGLEELAIVGLLVISDSDDDGYSE